MEQTSWMCQYIGKFRRHSLADCSFSYFVVLKVSSLGLLKGKESPGYAVDGTHQFGGISFVSRESGTTKLCSVLTYIELYQYPWLPVSSGNFLHCHCHQYNLLSIDLSLPQKSAHSSCDVAD